MRLFAAVIVILLSVSNAAAEQSFPLPDGWRRVRKEEIKKEDVPEMKRDHQQDWRLSAQGDFDNDGYQDIVRVLTKKSDLSKYVVYVTLNHGKSYEQIELYHGVIGEGEHYVEGVEAYVKEFRLSYYCFENVDAEVFREQYENECKTMKDFRYNGVLINRDNFLGNEELYIWDKKSKAFLHFSLIIPI